MESTTFRTTTAAPEAASALATTTGGHSQGLFDSLLSIVQVCQVRLARYVRSYVTDPRMLAVCST